MYLQGLLEWPTPRYGHLPVATDARGDKLSKQTHAPPLDERNPSPAIWAALRFLGQGPPPALADAPAAEIVGWALAHWRLERVPAVPARRWDIRSVESIRDGLTQTREAID
jgi:glutamyl-Q tRNA(Asp) synthetase